MWKIAGNKEQPRTSTVGRLKARIMEAKFFGLAQKLTTSGTSDKSCPAPAREMNSYR